MINDMREQLQALIDECNKNGVPSLEWLFGKLEAILAASPPAPSIKPGWRPIAEYDAMQKKPRDVVFWASECPSGRSVLLAKIFTERFAGYRTITHFMAIDGPNGGPECCIEVK